jgi:TfoX N-terminal domain
MSEHRFEELAARLVSEPDVTEGTGFGSAPGLRINGKIFAMLVKDELVVKLPKDRVDELVAAGAGTNFDPGHGRLMKEWASVPAESSEDWERLANEALVFVRR